MSVRLYVGNLPKEIDRQELEALFAQEVGDPTSTKVVTDRKTGKCRGFGFVTVETEAQADQVIEKLNGHVFKENALKIEKALPKNKENSTPTGESANVPAGGGQKTNNRRNSKGKSKHSGTQSYRSSSQAEAAQPDPRWADELEKLKEMLFAQTHSS